MLLFLKILSRAAFPYNEELIIECVKHFHRINRILYLVDLPYMFYMLLRNLFYVVSLHQLL